MGIISTINTFIPFADPSRPIWIDIIYSLVLCTLLWLGPQLQEYFLKASKKLKPATHTIGEDARRQDGTDTRQESEALHERISFTNLMETGEESSEDDEDDDSDAHILDVDDADFQRFLAEQPGPANQIPPPQFQGEGELPPQQPIREQLLPAAGVVGPNGLPPGQQPRLRDPNRPVGAKKARSLARRQQVRAYHEFVREQSDMQRAQDASTKDEREKAAQAERERRKAVEEKIRRDEAIQRESRKETERVKREMEAKKVRDVKRMMMEGLQKGKVVRVGDMAKEVSMTEDWVGMTIKMEGLLGEKKSVDGRKTLVMLVGEGEDKQAYIVRIDEQDVQEMYKEVIKERAVEEKAGLVNSAELGGILSRIIMRRNVENS